MINRLVAYRALGALGALGGFLSLSMATLFMVGTALVGPMGFLFGLGEMAWYATWGERVVNMTMHVLPGAVSLAFAGAFLVAGGASVWGAWAAWRRVGLLR